MVALDNIGFSPIKDKQNTDDQKSKFKIPGLQQVYNGSELPKQQNYLMESYAMNGQPQRGPVQPNPYSGQVPPAGAANLLPDTLPLFVAVPSPGVSPDRPPMPATAPQMEQPAPDNPFFALSGMSTPSSPFGLSPPHPQAGFGGFAGQAMHSQQSFDTISPFGMQPGAGMPHHMWAMGQGMQNFATPPVMSAGAHPQTGHPQNGYPQAPWLPISPSPHMPPQSAGGHPSGSQRAFQFQGGLTPPNRVNTSQLQGLYGKYMNQRHLLDIHGLQQALMELQYLNGKPPLDPRLVLGMQSTFDSDRDGCLTYVEFSNYVQALPQ